jgi:hypothetical protein
MQTCGWVEVKSIYSTDNMLYRVWVLETPFRLLLGFINHFTSHYNYFYNETRTSPSVFSAPTLTEIDLGLLG